MKCSSLWVYVTAQKAVIKNAQKPLLIFWNGMGEDETIPENTT